jgi:multidrug efflux pump subunit AcrA (membrane-fusion protein)
LALLLDSASLSGAEPKAAVKPGAEKKEAEKKTAEPAGAETPATHKVKREVFKVELALKGVFEAEKAAEIALRPEVWAGLEVAKAVEHGQAVKRGDVLIECDLDKIDEEIADLRAKVAISEISVKQAEEGLRTLEASTPLDLKLAERSRQHAQEDLDRFLKIDRPMSEKMANFMAKLAQHRLDYEREELQQLEKMYKASELTEETEEIVLRRQRHAVESAEFMLDLARTDRDETLQVELPRKHEGLEQNRERQDLLASKAKTTLPAALEQQRRELAKAKLERTKDEQKLKKLLADRDVLTVRAPADGVVYYGRFVRGKWSGLESAAENLRRGGSIGKNTVVMTVVALRPMSIRATVSESDLEKIQPGLKGVARPTAYPDLRLDARLARVDAVPSGTEGFDARIDVSLDGSDKRTASLVPGMACTVKMVPYLDRRALVVPAKAVFREDLDEDQRYVFLARKEAKPEKRSVTVGKQSEDKVEIVRGLGEGDEVLLERPKETPAGAEPQKEAAKKPAEAPAKKEPAKKGPAEKKAK